MADGKQFEYGQSASEVQFQDEVGKIKNRQGEAVIEVNDAQEFFLATSGDSVKIKTLIDDDAFNTGVTDTALATAESIKAYVDASGGGSGSFDDITVDTSTLVANVSGYTDKVGVATATPRRTLDVLHASDPQLRLSRTDNADYVDLHTTAGDNLLVEGSAGTNFYNITRGPTNVYSVYQSNSTGDDDGAGKGLQVGVTGNVAYLWMNGTGSNGTMIFGCAGANAITIDASNNTTAVNNLLANGNVTLGDAGTDEHTLNGTLNLASSPADLTCSGTTASFVAGETVSRGDVVYYKPADSRMWKAVADAAATSRAVAIAAEDITGGATGRYLLRGFIKDTGTFPTFTAGDVVYTNDTAGPPTDTAPSDSGDFVQVIGWAVDGDTVYFDPGSTIIEIA